MNKLLLGLLLVLVAETSTAEITAIRAGRLLDPDAGTIARDRIILIEGDTIQAIGPDLTIPSDARVIDLSDETVLPGLIDAHTHLLAWAPSQGPPPAGERRVSSIFFNVLTSSSGYRAIRGLVHAREMLHAGFTTVRDLGAEGRYTGSDLRRAIQDRVVAGPTVVNAGRIIAPFGGALHLQPMGDRGSANDPARENIQSERRDIDAFGQIYADSRDALIAAVRENVYFGARVIKLVVDDGPSYSADDIAVVVDEARKAGLSVAAHCRTAEGARKAIEAGVASVEHGLEMTDESLRLARDRGVILVPTPVIETKLCDWKREDIDRLREKTVKLLENAETIGVTLVFGSDVGVEIEGQSRGRLAMEGVSRYAEAGIPANVILRAMTVNAARLLGVDERRGAIRPGMAADLIATPGDPLENIEFLKRISFVMKDGVVVKRSPSVTSIRPTSVRTQ